MKTDKTFFLPLSVFFFVGIYRVVAVWLFYHIVAMELLYILQKNIPSKKEVFAKFRKKDTQDLSKFFLQMIKKIKKWQNDIRIVNAFCIELYDAIYHDILFGNIKINRTIVRIFETLALPMEYIGEQKRKDALHILMRMKI